MTNQVIPEAALTAAADAIRAHQTVLIGPPEGEHGSSLGFRSPEDLAPYILEAAAPHMLAEAWDEGMRWADALQSGKDLSDNPYRSRP